MNVRTKLQITAWLSGLAALVVLLVLSMSLHRVSSAMEGARIAGDIISATFERNAFRNDYLQSGSDRAKQQWFAKHAQIGGLLASAAKKDWKVDDRVLIGEITEDYESVGKLFRAIVNGREKTTQVPGSASLSERENRLLTQLVIRSYDTVLHARKLQESSRENLFSVINIAGWSFICLLAVVVVAVTGTSWNINRLIADRVTRLREGAAAVGEGNLDYRIGLEGDDEFVELSDVFDGMTEKLRQSYLDLEREGAERRWAVEALRESEGRFRGTFENAAVGITLFDPDGRLLQANGKLCEIVGYTEHELRGRSFDSFTHPDEVEPDWSRFALLMKGQLGSYEVEKRYIRKNGSPVWMRVTHSVRRDERGVPAYSIAVVQDITERKQAEDERERLIAELQRSRTLLAEAEKLSHTGAWEWNLITDTWTFSDEWLHIHGVQTESLAPDELLAIAHPEDRAAVREGFEMVRSGVKPYDLEHRIVRQDSGEKRIVRARGQYVKDAAGVVVRVYGFAQDITRRKRAEEELLKAKDELEERVRERTEELTRALQELRTQTEERIQVVEELRKKEQQLLQQSRLAAMGEMLVNISHQWRQPLNVLGLILQEMHRNYRRGNFTGEYLDASVTRGRELIAHMSETIDDFRNFFIPEKIKVSFDVKEVVETTISMVLGSIQEIQVDLQADHPVFIEGFRNEYAQTVMNILMNARDVFRERMVAEPRITVKIWGENGRSVVTITDNAGGIAGDILDRIFDPYFTTKAPDKGTGIGLFMSRTIIEKSMNGSLTVRNTDQGAEFRIEV